MKRVLRWASSALTIFFGVAFGTIARQNIETFAADRGWDSFLKSGFQAVSESGLTAWVACGLFFSLGITTTLWIDYAVRRFAAARKPKRAYLLFCWSSLWEIPLSHNTQNVCDCYIEVQGPRALVVVVFQHVIRNGHVVVHSSQEGLMWNEQYMSDKILAIRFDRRKPSCCIDIEITDESESTESRRQLPHIEQEAIFVAIPEKAESQAS